MPRRKPPVGVKPPLAPVPQKSDDVFKQVESLMKEASNLSADEVNALSTTLKAAGDMLDRGTASKVVVRIPGYYISPSAANEVVYASECCRRTAINRAYAKYCSKCGKNVVHLKQQIGGKTKE